VRTVVIGPPRAGKTTYANKRGKRERVEVRHTDDLIGELDWSGVSERVASDWFAQPGPWIIEGVAAVRALRKWLRYHAEGKPCDEIVLLEEPWVSLSDGQARMAKGCSKVWGEVEGLLRARGVNVVVGCGS